MRSVSPPALSGRSCVALFAMPQATGRSARRRHDVRAVATDGKNAEVTDATVAAMPWAQPGWRGAYLSSQPASTQQAAFVGAALALIVGTYISHTAIGPWICDNIPTFDQFPSKAPFILGPLFTLAGITHFTNHAMFCSIYPPKGTWGFWNLPGSPSFHVNWTGVAEILGGLGLVLGAVKLDFLPSNLQSISAYGLCLLTFVVSPSNFYMFSHNAPGPLSIEDLDKAYGPDGAPPVTFHAFRFVMQIFLLSAYLGAALQ